MGRPVKSLPELEELSLNYYVGLGLDCLYRRDGNTRVLSRTSITINKRQYSHVRCLYFLHHGYPPEEIEFRDGNKSNWHVDNLRNKPKKTAQSADKLDYSAITMPISKVNNDSDLYLSSDLPIVIDEKIDYSNLVKDDVTIFRAKNNEQ
jgi:hypothetical protein